MARIKQDLENSPSCLKGISKNRKTSLWIATLHTSLFDLPTHLSLSIPGLKNAHVSLFANTRTPTTRSSFGARTPHSARSVQDSEPDLHEGSGSVRWVSWPRDGGSRRGRWVSGPSGPFVGRRRTFISNVGLRCTSQCTSEDMGENRTHKNT